MDYTKCTEEELNRLRRKKTSMDLGSMLRELASIMGRNNGLSDDEHKKLSEATSIISILASRTC